MHLSRLDIALRALCLLPALALGGCDPKLQIGELFGEEDPSTVGGDQTGTVGGAETGDPNDPSATGSAGDETGGSSSDAASTGQPGDETEGPVTECDVWNQDCPFGEKCAPYASDGNAWNALKCVPLDPQPLPPGSACEFVGETLGGVDNCETGSFCWNVDENTGVGTCVSQCIGTPEDATCADAGDACIIANEGALTLCLPSCDPLVQDCEGSDLCLPVGEAFVCASDQSGDAGANFDPCAYTNACDKGLVCVSASLASECDQNAGACCLPYCDTTAGDDFCPGVGQSCVPLYDSGDAPDGLENVGLCQLAG